MARRFPPEERFELSSPLRRAFTFVSLNIYEGAGRYAKPDVSRFLIIARGSPIELDTILLVAERLGYLDEEQTSNAPAEIDRISALLNGLIKSLNT